MPPKHQPMPSYLPALEPLTGEELRMLRDARCEQRLLVRGTREIKMAQRLIKVGLLERDPSAVGMCVRCTELGARNAKALNPSSVTRFVEHVRDMRTAGDLDFADALEHDLWRRVLAEAACHGIEHRRGLVATLETTRLGQVAEAAMLVPSAVAWR